MKNSNKTELICGTIAFCVVVFSIMVVASANSKYTFQIKMDDNTREYLVAHDYCVFADSDYQDTTVTFVGDCQYLNYSMFKAVQD